MIADTIIRDSGTEYHVSIICSEVLKCRKMFDCLMHEMLFIRQLKYNVTVHSESSICVYIFFIFTLSCKQHSSIYLLQFIFKHHVDSETPDFSRFGFRYLCFNNPALTRNYLNLLYKQKYY